MKKLVIIIMLIGLSGLIFYPASASFLTTEKKASVDAQTKAFAVGSSSIGYSDASLEENISNIIRLALSILGVIFVVLAFVAGNNWMQAAGNEEKVKKSQATIRNLIIGLALTLLAYSLSSGLGGLMSSLVLKQ